MEQFDTAQGMILNDSAQQLVNDVLVWIGFGTVVGLLAKGIMPGRDPGGAIATVMMGIGGTIMGCGMVSYFNHGQRVVPISPMAGRHSDHSVLLQTVERLLFCGRRLCHSQSSASAQLWSPAV